CPSDQFECENGACIDLSWVCDGVTDCLGETVPGSDEEDCPAASCRSSEFQCSDGSCILSEFRCDGDPDCSDGGDEQACRYPTCDELKCKNGACFTSAQRCDGNVDCRDESDEFNCSESSTQCSSNEFQCDNGKCIPQSFYCDVWNNCGDGSDEPDGVLYPSCPGNTFTCDNSVCVNQEWVCDGTDNCGDGSDEENCDYAIPCLNNQWRCTNSSRCINVVQICDGKIDCEDGTDESQTGSVCSSTKCGILSCDGYCRATPQGGTCYCDDGYQVGDDGISCKDFDECTVFGQCEQKCENTVGSFKCGCADGYIPEQSHDHLHCKATPTAGAPRLLFSAGPNIYFNDFLNDKLDIAVEAGSPIGVDYHYELGKIFWSDAILQKVMSANTDGNNQKVILDKAISDPEQVAVDWIGNNLYVVETKVGRIDICNFDGSHRTGVVTNGLRNPRGLALDPTKGYMFFTDWYTTTARLDRAYMDGSELYTIVDTSVGYPSGITVDFTNSRVYWVDTKFDYVETVDYNGKNRRTILSGSHLLPWPYDVTLFEEHVYISDATKLGILRGNKFNGSIDYALVTKTGVIPNGLIAYHPSRQPKVDNPCAVQNGGCAHLCVLSHVLDGLGYSCLCDLGYVLNMDRKSCKREPRIITVSNRYYLYQLNLDTNARKTALYSRNLLGNDFDWATRKIYYADTYYGNLYKAFLNGTMREIVFSSGTSITENIAVDWVARNLYWCDYDLGTIEVARIDGTHRAILHAMNVTNPRGLALDPRDGYHYLFWTDWGQNPRIERCDMDGNHRKSIITDRLFWPNGLTIDYPNTMVYLPTRSWTSYTDADMTDKTEQKHPHSLTILEDYLYWTDRETYSVSRCNKWDGSKNQTKVMTGLYYPTDLHAFHPVRQPAGTNYCEGNPCSHICLLGNFRPRYYTCACPVGSSLTDTHTCTPNQDDFILVSTPGRIFGIALDPEDQESDKMIPVTNIVNGMDVEHDDSQGWVYWGGDGIPPKISRCNMDGSYIENIITTSVNNIQHIALDYSGGRIFWAEQNSETYLEVGTYNRRYRLILIKIVDDMPVAIAINPLKRLLYWADYGQVPKIESAYMDGTNRTILATSGLTQPRSIVIDYSTHDVYWCDEQSSTIEKMSWDGSNRVTIRSGRNYPSPRGVAVYQDYIYWVDPTWKSVRNPSNQDDPEKLRDGLENPQDVAIYDQSIQPDDPSNNPCANNNGGCSQLCIALPDNSRVCKCAFGKIGNDGTSCNDAEDYVVFTTTRDISGFHVDPDDHSLIFPTVTASYPIAVAHDLQDNRAYFATVSSYSRIGYIDLNSNPSYPKYVVTSGLRGPEGTCLDFDWVHRKLYYTDNSLKIIGSVSPDGSNMTTVVSGLNLPRGIAVDPCRGYIYWTDWGTHTIERSTLVGNGRTVIVSEDLLWPNGVTIDFDEDKLYWVDAEPKERVERSNMDGTERELIIPSLDHPFAIAILDQFVYWTDWSTRGVYR
uniref:EGF-like domain-containing protein n=1 Tax=Ciona savignyi TaxID=51511 RepID=H2YAY7_CIOSA